MFQLCTIISDSYEDHDWESSDHRCPFLIGWLINRGVCLPIKEHVIDDRWYTKSVLLFCPKGHHWQWPHDPCWCYQSGWTGANDLTVTWMLSHKNTGSWIRGMIPCDCCKLQLFSGDISELSEFSQIYGIQIYLKLRPAMIVHYRGNNQMDEVFRTAHNSE